MRLGQLILSGFKSFVDPTRIVLSNNLTGIVGPNGCGKSNVIDAVRWVLGESSAKHLRGESMADVVFNGSTERKAAGQASVELIFEETLGCVTGDFARFNEISVKRVVNREGQSNYYLNQRRCRRKDIVDIFLGTGLASRSYSIIEQGMIARIIEAKPEDLRVYLEEAAGISKYRERRRETENKIKHTRENLERILDIREELAKQLERLKAQAAKAEDYRKLNEEQRILHSQTLALSWRKFDESFNETEQAVQKILFDLEANEAKKHAVLAELETNRLSQQKQQAYLDDQKQAFYALSIEIAKLEQSIAHEKEKREQLKAALVQCESDLQSAENEFNRDSSALLEITDSLLDLQPELDKIKEVVDANVAALEQVELSRATWQEKWHVCSEQAADSSQQAHIEKTRIHHLEEKIQLHEENLKKHHQQSHELYDDRKTCLQKIDLNQAALEVAESACRGYELELNETNTTLNDLKQLNRELRQQFKEDQAALQGIIREKVALEALQKAALGYEKSDQSSDWLEKNGLAREPRLAETIQVEAGWEKAVESVLSDEFQAIVIKDNQTNNLLADLDSLVEGRLAILFESELAPLKTDPAETLGSKVSQVPSSLSTQLQNIFLAETVTDALQLQVSLTGDQSVVTRNGLWLGRDWVKVNYTQEDNDSVLIREQSIKALTEEIAMKQSALDALEQKQMQTDDLLTENEVQLNTLRETAKKFEKDLSEKQSQMNVHRSHLRDLEQRQVKVSIEISSIEKALAQAQQEVKSARHAWEKAVRTMTEDAESKESLESERLVITENMEVAKSNLKEIEKQYHDRELQIESMNAKRQAYELNLARVKSRIQQYQAKLAEFQSTLADQSLPEKALEIELNDYLNQNKALEKVLIQDQERLKKIEETIQLSENNLSQMNQMIESFNDKANELKLQRQTFLVKRQTIFDQIESESFDPPEILLDTLPPEATLIACEKSLQIVRDKIKSLGSINLAAIEEYGEASTRKQHLDEQYHDLDSALVTLEDAIAKIDKETRSRFQHCYDQVNASFRHLFPRLFGGGQAYLQLTGEDLIDTGVQVIARPPGKKNSSIHLLSGGEKAMTAVALVFAIFQLNPSPFCLLDEVDAPLDDANVGRFCNMVREMSDKTQFIMITHNKLTMEIAHSLIGVTMQEPGVSRLVSVDIEEAVRMAEA